MPSERPKGAEFELEERTEDFRRLSTHPCRPDEAGSIFSGGNTYRSAGHRFPADSCTAYCDCLPFIVEWNQSRIPSAEGES